VRLWSAELFKLLKSGLIHATHGHILAVGPMNLIESGHVLLLLANSLLHYCLQTFFFLLLAKLLRSLLRCCLLFYILIDPFLKLEAFSLGPDQLDHSFLPLHELLLALHDLPLDFLTIIPCLVPSDHQIFIGLPYILMQLLRHLRPLRYHLFLLGKHLVLLQIVEVLGTLLFFRAVFGKLALQLLVILDLLLDPVRSTLFLQLNVVQLLLELSNLPVAGHVLRTLGPALARTGIR
jgi:hypothetical protein